MSSVPIPSGCPKCGACINYLSLGSNDWVCSNRACGYTKELHLKEFNKLFWEAVDPGEHTIHFSDPNMTLSLDKFVYRSHVSNEVGGGIYDLTVCLSSGQVIKAFVNSKEFNLFDKWASFLKIGEKGAEYIKERTKPPVSEPVSVEARVIAIQEISKPFDCENCPFYNMDPNSAWDPYCSEQPGEHRERLNTQTGKVAKYFVQADIQEMQETNLPCPLTLKDVHIVFRPGKSE